MADAGAPRDEQFKKLAAALGAQSAPAPAAAGVRAGDLLRELGAGALQGTGGAIRGVGEYVNNPDSGIAEKDKIVTGAAARALGGSVSAAGDDLAAGTTDAAKKAKADSTPSGDLLSPSKWGQLSLGKDPSISGYGLHAANVIGQILPTAAAALLSRGQTLPTMAAAGAAGGGGAAQQEQQRIEQMPQAELEKLPAYQQRVAAGFNANDARADLAARTANTAFQSTLPVSSLSAFTEGLPLAGAGQNLLAKAVGNSRAARALTGGAVDAIGEGAQEVAEQAAQTAGANVATGEQRSLTEDSFQNFALGTLGGGPVGALGGLMSPGPEGVSLPPENAAAPTDSAGQSPVSIAPGAGADEAAMVAARQPKPEPQPSVTDAQPEFRAGATNPATGEVQVAPGVVVNPAAGTLSRTVAEAAQRGDMDKAPTATLSDGTQFNPESGEVTQAPEEQPKPAKKEKPPKPTPDQLDQYVLERLQINPVMDSQTTAMMARSLGIDLHQIVASKKRARDFLAQQKLENPKDPTLKGDSNGRPQNPQEQPRQPVGADAGGDAQSNGRIESAQRPEADAAQGAARPVADQGSITWDNMKPGQSVTLYRGEGAGAAGDSEKNGQWWTTDKAKAERYGKVASVTLPSDVIARNAARGHNGAHEFVFPSKRPDELAKVDAGDIEALAAALKKTDRAKGPDGATYMVKQNSNGEGYHLTRTTDTTSLQRRSPNPAQPWTREQAVSAAADYARESVTPKPKELPNGNSPDRSHSSAVDSVAGQQLGQEGNPDGQPAAGRGGAVQAVPVRQREKAASPRRSTDGGLVDGSRPASAGTDVGAGNAPADALRGSNDAGAASSDGSGPVRGGELESADRGSLRATGLDGSDSAVGDGSGNTGQAAGSVAADKGSERPAGAQIGVAEGGMGGGAKSSRDPERVAQGAEGAGAPRPDAAVQTDKEAQQGAARDGAPAAVRTEQGAATQPAKTGQAGPAVAEKAAASSAAPAARGRNKIINKAEAIKRLRGAGMKVREAQDAFNAIGAKHLRPELRFEADVQAKIDEHTAAAKNLPPEAFPLKVTKGSGSGAGYFSVRTGQGVQVGEFRIKDGKADSVKAMYVDSALPDVQKVADEYAAKNAPPKVSENRLVSDDVAAAARARLKAKLGQMNAGIDPTMLADGAILAVYHIERGARTFAAYAKAMVADLGTDARDYLAAWYEGARRMPGMNSEGMSTTAEVDASQAAGIPELSQENPDGQESTPAPAAQGEQTPVAEQRRDPGNAADADGKARQRRGSAESAPVEGNADPAQEQRQGREGADEALNEGESRGTGIRSSVADRGGAGSLESAPVGAVQPPQESGTAGAGTEERRGADVAGDAGAAEKGRDDAGGSVAGSAGDAPDSGSDRVRQSSAVTEAVNSHEVAVQQVGGGRPRNFVIGPDFPLGEGGPKAKAQANVNAIRALKAIEADGREATPEEQAVLARYVGWGGIPQAFRHETRGITEGWAKAVQIIEGLMTPEELAAARRSTQDAHYTSREVVSGIYDALSQLGFRGGAALEPAIGTGNFLGLAPDSMRGATRWKGVELDSITGRIAQQLYPDAQIIAGKGFEEVTLPSNQFDAVIGNPPFGSNTLFDPSNPDLKGFSIHNFFFAKSLKSLRPGGVLAMVVSNQMLDKAGGKQRRWMADRANFLGAIRLPNTAFKANAGTEVTTDIVFLQKLRAGEKPTNSGWTEVGTVPDPAAGDAIPLNQYFVDHPEMMLGTMTREGKMRRAGEPTLSPNGVPLDAALAEAVKRLPRDVLEQPALIAPGEAAPFVDVAADIPVYGHFVDSAGAIQQRLPDQFGDRQARTVELSPGNTTRMQAMIDLRDRMKGLMRAEMADAAAPVLNAQRAALNRAYDAFQAKYGYLNSSYNANLFREDADAFRLRSLEIDYQRLDSTDAAARGLVPPRGRSTVEVAKKADILERRVFTPVRRPKAETAADAMAISLNSFGRLNVDAMADMLGKSVEQVVAELGGQIFADPAAGYVTADEYLSGNVKAKLAQARAAYEADQSYARNVRALEQVQPADIAPVDIHVSLGSPWVRSSDYQEFGREVLGIVDAAVRKIEMAQKFSIGGYNHGAPRFSTPRMTTRKLFQKILAGEPIQLYDTVYIDGKESRKLNTEATDAAIAAANVMREEFLDWVWKDQKRRESLARIYNDTYNTDQPRRYDGSFLSFPGKVDDSVITLRPTQINAVWRIVQDGGALLDHVVGAGKTYTAIAAVMTMRRMGLHRKPMITVPNHLVGQWAGDFMRLYPSARILAVSELDFAKDRRKLLMSRIATGDWDAIIVAHSQFTRIPPPDNFETEYMAEKLADTEQLVKEMSSAGEDKRTIKQIEKRRDQLKTRLKERMEGIARDDDIPTLEEMGIDDLIVDEAHEFKNLGFVTNKRNVRGLGNPQGSRKAEDLFIKSRYLHKLNNGRGLTFMTGTPVSNSLAEMFTMSRYLAYDEMKARGIHLFDLWANTFAQESQEYELDSSGRGLAARTVLKKFLNVPEMMQLYKRFADVITQEDLKRIHKEKTGQEWPIPKVKGGKPQNFVVPPSPALLEYIEGEIIPRMQAVSGELGTKPDPSVDNMLRITNDARLAALDVRLRMPEAEDDPNSKPNAMVREALALYRATAADKGTQLIFCDLSTPKSAANAQRDEVLELQRLAEEGDDAAQAKLDKMSPDDLLATLSVFSVYDDVRTKLIAFGVPPREIAFIHDAKTDLQKQALFAKVNAGDVRFLMGSTSKMGAGTNVQRLLVGLHHLDAPWRPSDLEQREGRGIRQGNLLYARDPAGFELVVNRYATERTYDARMWQLIERKAAIVEQIRKADPTLREVDDVVGEAANAAEMKAAATGNPLLIEQVETEGKVKRLNGVKRSYDSRMHDAEARLAKLAADGGIDARHAAGIARAAAADAVLEQNPREPFSMTVGDQTYDTVKDGVSAFGAKVLATALAHETKPMQPTAVATYRGARVELQKHLGYFELHVIYPDPVLGDVGSTAIAIDGENKISLSGTMQRLNNVYGRMADWRSDADAKKRREERQAQEMRDVIAEPFRQAAELRQATDRLRDINAELVRAANAPKAPKPLGLSEDRAPAAAGGPVVAANLQTNHARMLRAAINSIVRGWKGVKVTVFDNPDQLRKFLGRDDPRFDRVRGVVYNTGPDTANVYLVASNLASIERAKRTLAHEVIGHFGMEQLLGDQFDRVATDALALVRGDAKYAEILSRVNNYADMGEKVMAMEAVAMMAEGQYQNGLMARIYAAVRAFLRSLPGLGTLNFSHEEIVAMTVRAARALTTPPTDPVKSTDPAFNGNFDLIEGDEISRAPPAAVLGSIEGAAQARLDKAGVANIGDRLRDKLTDWKPSLLGALTLRQLGEVATKYMPQVNEYADVMTRLATRRNQLQEGAAELADRWEKWQRKNREASKVLAEVMHDATLAGVDPDKDYVPGVVTLTNGEAIPADSAAAEADALEARAKPMSGPGREILLRDAARLRAAAEAEPSRRAAYDPLRARYEAMKPEAKAIYRDVRDMYANRADEMLNAVLGRIKDLPVPEDERLSLTKQMRAHFESARVTAPYFPLARFGEYWVSAERNGEKRFQMMETRTAQKRVRETLEANGWKTTIGTKLDMTRASDGASSSFVAQVTTLLEKAGVNNGVADEIYQLYLRTLPDLSVRKQFIHRKGTAGYDSDALRAFAAQSNHGAHQLARLEYGETLEKLVRAMKVRATELSSDGVDDDAVAASRMVNEMQKRHQWVMNPTDSSAVQKISGLAFAYYLGATPAAALVNLTQNYVVTFPALAAKHGFARALNEVNRSMAQSIRTYGHIEKLLTGDEARAHKELMDMGAIDRTLSHDLAGIGDTDTRDYNPTWRRVMGTLSHMFHKAEVFNRESAGLAAYRMGRADGMSHDAAVKYASDTIWQTHFDYSNANRARWVQSNAGKILFAMKQYSQNMTYFLWRQFHQATKGATPEEKSMARRKLAGTLGMTALFSGVLGLPLMSLMFGVANAVQAAFGDDDEPWDAETEFRNFLVEMLGEDFGRLAQVGPAQMLTGADVSGRTKLDQLWFRAPDRELEGRAMADYILEQIGGPVAGIGINALRSVELANDGHLMRAVETALPKSGKDFVKALRYANEGVNDLRGNPVVSDPSPYELLMQASGLTPARVAEQYDVNSALKNYEQHILNRRKALLNAYALATATHDVEALRALRTKMEAFNAANPEIGISASTVRKSLQSRQRYNDSSIGGIVLNKKLDQRLRESVSFGDESED